MTQPVSRLLLRGARPQHIGTLDIDLDLNPDALADGEYATPVETLEKKDYERGKEGLKPFQLRRWVKLDDGEPVGVLVDLLMPRGARGDQNEEKLVEGLRVQGAHGGSVALAHHVTRKFEGTMPDGRSNEVELVVATIPALLVMRGYALVGRDKKKDSYDIYFSVRNYHGDPTVLAVECAKLLTDKVARRGYEHIAGKFRSAEDFGPRTVRLFLEESSALGEMTPDQVQTDAFMQVAALLRGMGLQKQPSSLMPKHALKKGFRFQAWNLARMSLAMRGPRTADSSGRILHRNLKTNLVFLRKSTSPTRRSTWPIGAAQIWGKINSFLEATLTSLIVHR